MRSEQRPILLLSRSWPSRAYLYAALREAGADVRAVAEPDQVQALEGETPWASGLLLFDVAGFAGRDVSATLAWWGEGRDAVVLAGPLEAHLLPDPLPARAVWLRKPVSMGAVVARCLRGGPPV